MAGWISNRFVSRGGLKLDHALVAFDLNVHGLICADLGCSAGGFVDCLLQRGAARVYAIDTGYGFLDWKLRKDPRVVVMERTNAMHVELPQQVQFISIDVAWTRQRNILPAAQRLLASDGNVVSLVKPHYEANASQLRRGVLPRQSVYGVFEKVTSDIQQTDFEMLAAAHSPIAGHGGNAELLVWLRHK